MTRVQHAFIIAVFCLGAVACANAPEVDPRPKLLISAEKSLELGVDNYNQNNFSKAEAHFNRALFLYRNTDNPTGIISSCLNIAKTKLSSGQINSARNYTQQAKIVIEREQVNGFNDRLTLIESSIAIEDNQINEARQKLESLLNKTSSNASIKTAALQNRTRIAFIENSEIANWVKRYREALNRPGQDTKLNQARLLRFEAALNPDTAKEKLSGALSIYRETAHSPGIAATLFEWANHDNTNNDYPAAINKLQRALFIRVNLNDRKKSRKILQQLSTSYNQLGEADKSERANYWQKKLDNEFFEEWDAIRFEFENYPN